MLPFLKPKQKSMGISMPVEYRKPDMKDQESDGSGEALEAAAKDLMSAISKNDHKAVASAIRAAFDILESQPHEENMEGHEE